MKMEAERFVLYAIMREASYLKRGSEVRIAIEEAASNRLRELRVELPDEVAPSA